MKRKIWWILVLNSILFLLFLLFGKPPHPVLGWFTLLLQLVLLYSLKDIR